MDVDTGKIERDRFDENAIKFGKIEPIINKYITKIILTNPLTKC